MLCSGSNEAFGILDDASKPWPVAQVGSTVTMQWKLTAAHSSASWEQFVDGTLHQSFDSAGAKPAADISHVLTGLPTGKHVILARWNVADTPMAFYSCSDVVDAGRGARHYRSPPHRSNWRDHGPVSC